MHIKWDETAIHNAYGKLPKNFAWHAMIEPTDAMEGWWEYSISLTNSEGLHLNLTDVAPTVSAAKGRVEFWLKGHAYLWEEQ